MDLVRQEVCAFSGSRAWLTVPALLVAFCLAFALQPTPALSGSNDLCEQAGSLMKQGRTVEASTLLHTALEGNPKDRCLTAQYLAALVQLGAYDKAKQLYLQNRDMAEGMRSVSRDVAAALFHTGDYRGARRLYEDAFEFDNSDAEALKGIIFASCKLDEYATAEKYWQIGSSQGNIPGYILAELKVYLLHRMGTPFMALESAQQAGIKDKDRMGTLAADAAAKRVKWDEFDTAIRILEEELRLQPDNVKAKHEYIVALSKKYRMKEVLEHYSSSEKMDAPAPYTVTEAVADAYSYLKQPKEAEKFYKIRLEQNPVAPFRPHLGLFTTYTTLREWAKAEQEWKNIENLIENNEVSWMEKHEALTARGWFLIAQDRLAEAQSFFESQLREAGLDPGFRSGLAHTYAYRGWPHKALEQFRIAENVKPEDVPTRAGMAQTLSDLDQNREARNLASELYRTYPYDLHVKDVYETLRLKDGHVVGGDARFINEAPGATEYRFQLNAATGITPMFRIFADVLHMRAYETVRDARSDSTWDRVGAGFSWVLTPGFTFTQSGSWDYVEKADFGSTTKIAWNPDDHFKVSAGYESFSLDIPLRARALGARGQTGLLELRYHESDLRDYALFLQSNWLSDGNSNPSAVLGFQQTVINKPDWKLRVGPEFYYARYSKNADAVPYFSPMFEYSLVLKPVLQITHLERYDKSFRSYVYADVGAYKQHAFNVYPIGGFAYAQELKTSKTFSVRWMAGYGARVYDGRYSNVLEVLLTLNKHL